MRKLFPSIYDGLIVCILIVFRTKETRWSKPIELAKGTEREEMLRRQAEAQDFFKEMEANIRRFKNIISKHM
jgi:hypothetical protein